MSDRSAPRRSFLPLGIDLQGQRCLVVGGGAVGTRKALTLLRAGARVAVMAPAVTDELRARSAAGELRWVESPYTDGHLHGVFLVVAATDSGALNAAITRAARAAGALACDASSAAASPVIFGALLEREDATIAVFTDGRDPAAARATRDRIAGWLEREPAS